MDTTVVAIAILAVIAVIIVAGAVVVVTMRRPKRSAPPPLSTMSEDRTFVGITHAPVASDRTMIGPAAPPVASDRTMVGPAAPPVASAAPTVATPAPRAEAPTMATVRVPKLRGRLTVTKGGGGTHELEAREYTIGRSSHADVVLADPSVSGQHAKLTPHGEAFAVVDLGSTNGTTVDGRPVRGSYVLRGGETIGFGEARARYEKVG